MKRAASFLLIALLAVGRAQSFAEGVCSKLVNHEPAIVVDIHMGDRLYWDGSPITRSRFAYYMQITVKEQPKTIFHITWRTDKQSEAAKLETEIKAKGFEVAIDCPPIPF